MRGNAFSSPMGYLYFYSRKPYMLQRTVTGSRPLWGIYISILKDSDYNAYDTSGSRPLWGIYISIQIKTIDKDRIQWFSSPMGYLYFYLIPVLLCYPFTF